MSRRLVFSYTDTPVTFHFEEEPRDPLCDICHRPPRAGAIVAHLENSAYEGAPAALVACQPCAVELACFVIREFWPRPAQPPSPPETPPGSGGGVQ